MRRRLASVIGLLGVAATGTAIAVVFRSDDDAPSFESVGRGEWSERRPTTLATAPRDASTRPAGAGAPTEGVVVGHLKLGERPALVRIERGATLLREERAADGPFEVRYPPEHADATAVIVAEGFRRRAFALPAPSVDLGIVSLVPSVGYGGRVLDDESRPLAGVRVEMLDHRGRVAGVSLPTPADGRYRIDLDDTPAFAADPKGRLFNYRLRAVHDGTPLSHEAHRDGWTFRHDLQISATVPAHLRFVDAGTSRPMVGTRVVLHEARPHEGRAALPPPIADAVTDERGEVPFLRGVAETLVAVVRPGTGPSFLLTVDPSFVSPPVHEIEVGARDLVRLSARVVAGPEARPAPGTPAWVTGAWLEHDPEPEAPRPAARTVHLPGVAGPDGRVEWTFLAGEGAGPFVPEAWYADAEVDSDRPPRFARGKFPRTHVPAGGEIPPISITTEVTKPMFLWATVVEEPDGRDAVPSSGILSVVHAGRGDARQFAVHFSSSPGSGAAAGAWQMSLLGGASWAEALDSSPIAAMDVHLVAVGRAMRRVEVDPTRFVEAWRDGRVYALRLPAARRLGALRVNDAQGRAVPRATVSMVDAQARPHEAHVRRVSFATDETGAAWLDDLDPGVTYVAMALDPSTGAAARHGPWLPNGEVAMTLRPARAASLRPVYEDGRPASATASVETNPRGLLPPLTVRTDRDGWIRLPSIALDVVEIHVAARDPKITAVRFHAPPFTHRRVLFGVDVRDGDTVRLEPE